MHLGVFTIQDYKSITGENEINLDNFTVLLGKNNEGKSNVLYSLVTAFKIINNQANQKVSFFSALDYKFDESYPVSKINNDYIVDKYSMFKLYFLINQEESLYLTNLTGDLFISSFTVRLEAREKGGNSSVLINDKKYKPDIIQRICKFITDKIDVQYIPAIRDQSKVYELIESFMLEQVADINDEEYQRALKVIQEKQKEKMNNLREKLLLNIHKFLPYITNLEFDFLEDKFRRKGNIDIRVDDGEETSLRWKGDGIKNLFFIALLSQLESTKKQIIIIDEPETHLHPDAIRLMKKALIDLSAHCQIIISTHNPIFVNRGQITSNMIVDNSKIKQVKRIEDIRKILGVICSDNLMYADYVVLVEGESDKKLLSKFLCTDSIMKSLIESGVVLIKSIGGLDNLLNEVAALSLSLSNYCIMLDNDASAKDMINKVKNKRNLEFNPENYRFFALSCNNELEDLFLEEYYRDYFFTKGIKLESDIMKNRSIKWSDKVQKCARKTGVAFELYEEELKKWMAENIPENLTKCLKPEAMELLYSLLDKIKLDLVKIGVIKEEQDS